MANHVCCYNLSITGSKTPMIWPSELISDLKQSNWTMAPMWKYKFGTQQDKNHLDLLQGVIIEEVLLLSYVMILPGDRLSTTWQDGSMTWGIMLTLKWLFSLSATKRIWNWKEKFPPKRAKILQKNTIWFSSKRVQKLLRMLNQPSCSLLW